MTANDAVPDLRSYTGFVRRAKTKIAPTSREPFGRRLARLRKAAGYSQYSPAQELGVTRRMIVYYERESDYPPTALLPLLVQALHVTADELLGLGVTSREPKPADARVWRRFKQVEKLPRRERHQVLEFIDTVVEREQLKKKVPA